MPEYLSPGVYTEEIEIGGKPIEGVSTSTAGFVGETERGPTKVRLITGFTDFERVYGSYGCTKSYLPYAVSGFFENGGKRCFIGRVVSRAAKPAQLNVKTLGISAIGPGDWGNRIGVAIQAASNARKGQTTNDVFKLVVYYWEEKPPTPVVDPDDPEKFKDPNRRKPKAHESFDNLSWDPNSADYFLTRLHNNSHLIEAAAVRVGGDVPPPPPPPPEGAGPARRNRPPDAPPSDQIQLLSGGADGDAVTLEDYKGDEDEDTPTGFAGLAEKEDVSIVCAPNENDIPGLGDEVVSHCERLNCFAVLQCKQDAGDVGDLYPADGRVNSKYAAFYYPWLKITDPDTNREKLIPPGGHMAGIYARTDTERGVHKAPANESVHGIIDLQFNLTTGQQDVLNPRGVNCIRFFMGRGLLVWGARTTSDDPLWKYINVRRLFIFLEKSIQRSTQWVVFEPNNEALWARLKQGVSDWLTSVWRDGALMGTTPEEAFFVKCDRTTMTENDIETGRLIMIIGVAPTRPAEFVIFRLAQWRSGSAITE